MPKNVFLGMIFFMKATGNSLFSFYIHASIHVGLVALSLVLLTYFLWQIPIDAAVCNLVFCGTIFSYNFIKFHSVCAENKQNKTFFDFIKWLNWVCLLGGAASFLFVNTLSQLTTIFFGLLTLLYALPMGIFKKNLRNFSGIKIYIVSFCWAGVTLLLPLFNADFSLSLDFILIFLQRYLLTLVLLLIFEIKDLQVDAPELKTFPQTFGVHKTKTTIVVLGLLFYVLEFFKLNFYPKQRFIMLILLALIFIFTYFVHPNQKKYFTLFWVESVPIIWLVLSIILTN